MKCPEAGTIQAYIDGELEIGMRKDMEIHLKECGDCGKAYAALKENDDFTFGKLTSYKDHCASIQSQPAKPVFSGTSGGSGRKGQGPSLRITKGVYEFMKNYKRYISAACAVVVLATCIAVQPVRAAISDALSIFRVDNFKGLRITPQEFSELRANLEKGQGDISLDSLGKMNVVGGQSKDVSQQEASSLAGFPVKFAESPAGSNPEIKLTEPATVSFTLDAANVNTVLRSFKAKELLPTEIDGKTFTADFGARITARYHEGTKDFNLIETTTPAFNVPEGVDADQLFKIITDVPVFPEDLKSRIKSISDWKNTLYIPLMESPDAAIEEVSLNGITAYVYTGAENAEDPAKAESGIVWMDNGVITAIASNAAKGDLIAFAEELK